MLNLELKLLKINIILKNIINNMPKKATKKKSPLMTIPKMYDRKKKMKKTMGY